MLRHPVEDKQFRTARDFNVLRCVGLGWLSTIQALRSDTRGNTRCTRSTHLRRREGLRSFPRPLLSISAYPATRSAIVRLSLAFSCSSFFSRFAWSRSSPPYSRRHLQYVWSGDTSLTYCVTNTLATCNGNFDLPEFVQDLFRAMSFSWHFCLLSIHSVSDLSTGYV